MLQVGHNLEQLPLRYRGGKFQAKDLMELWGRSGHGSVPRLGYSMLNSFAQSVIVGKIREVVLCRSWPLMKHSLLWPHWPPPVPRGKHSSQRALMNEAARQFGSQTSMATNLGDIADLVRQLATKSDGATLSEETKAKSESAVLLLDLLADQLHPKACAQSCNSMAMTTSRQQSS